MLVLKRLSFFNNASQHDTEIGLPLANVYSAAKNGYTKQFTKQNLLIRRGG
jgi:hypothetical protein